MNNAADTTFTATETIEILADEFGFDAAIAANYVPAVDEDGLDARYTDADIENLAEIIENSAA